MFKSFYPNEDIKSTYDIDFEKLYDMGYRGVIFDIDNTLVTHGAPANEKAIRLFERLRGIGYSTMLLSNNKEPRVKSFADDVCSRYIFKAGKPKKKNYLKACEIMGTDAENTLFVGDQLFTDMWGANNAGIHSILVSPIDPKEEIQIVIKRIFEKLVLYFYKKQK